MWRSGIVSGISPHQHGLCLTSRSKPTRLVAIINFTAAQRTPAGRLVHEPPLHQLQQAVPHVPAQPAHPAPRKPGLPGGAPVAARLVPEGLRLLPEMPGGARQGTQALVEGRLGLSLFLEEVRVGSTAVVEPALTNGVPLRYHHLSV